MTWRMLGKPIYTADNSSSSPGVTQKFNVTNNILLKSIRIGIIHYNDPVYTTIQLKIYGDRNGSVGKLLLTSSNSIAKETISIVDHAFKETYFEFSGYPIKTNTYYHASLFINGAYVGDNASHLAWKTTWPDPIFDTGITQLQTKAAKYPFDLSVFGALL